MATYLSEGNPSPALRRSLERLDRLVDWERRDRSVGGMRVDLGPVWDLLERLDHPERRLRCVHVAGTKGKGSTTSLIETGLRRAGLRAGAYFSPHVERVNERVRIGGAWIADEPLAAALERALGARDAALAAGGPGANATWFDVFTAAAFVALVEAGVEWAAIEVGLGGRLDSTNVVRGDVCVITSIAIEHAAILGSTRAAIAREKAGILKPGAPLVTGVDPGSAPWSDEAGAAIEHAAAALGCSIVRPAPRAWASFEERNRALAALALDELGRRGVVDQAGAPLAGRLLDEAAVREAHLPARAERFELPGGVTAILDGAHVPTSLAALLEELRRDPRFASPPVVVLGMGRDKDARGMLKLLAGGVDRVLCTSVGDGPCLREEDLAETAREAGAVAETATPPRVALKRALMVVPPGGWVLVVGSLHLAGALRDELRAHPERTPC